MCTTVSKRRLISDKAVRHFAVVGYDNLAERLQAVVDTSLRATNDDNTILVDCHLVALSRHEDICAHLDALATLRCVHRFLKAEVWHHILSKALCGVPRLIVDHDACLASHDILTLSLDIHVGRLGNDAVVACYDICGECKGKEGCHCYSNAHNKTSHNI